MVDVNQLGPSPRAVGSTLVIGAVAVGLVVWTIVMASGAVRTFRRR